MFSETIPFDNYYTEDLYMTADVETGILYNRSGRRMLALTNDFLIGLHRALADECGDRSDDVLLHCGKRWGLNFAAGLDGEWSQFYGTPTSEFPMAMFHSLLTQEFGHNGWGILSIDYHSIENGIISLSLEGAIMAEIMPGDANDPADLLTAGIFGGMLSHFMGKDLACVQSQGVGPGQSLSRFLVASTARIAMIKPSVSSKASHDDVLSMLIATSKN
jgi:predicted hydrocarbon binding protein